MTWLNFRAEGNMRLRWLGNLLVTVGFLAFVHTPAKAQIGGNPFSSNPSFGMLNKRNVSLRSRLPPVFNAAGKTVEIRAGDDVLTIALEKDLTQNDSHIQVTGANGDLLIECSISTNSPVHEVSTSDSNGSSKYWQGELSVIFRISSPRSRIVIKSDVATSHINELVSSTSNASGPSKVFGMKVGATPATTTGHAIAYTSTNEAEGAMVATVARRIASYLVNTEILVNVPLAVGGALAAPNKLAESSLWPRYLEALETMKPYPDPKNDAYRLYDIGVANEALAYQAQDNKAAIKYLEQASNDYGKAIDTKPEEKYFIPAQSRIKAALQHYADIGKTSPLGAAGPLGTNLSAETPAAGALTNKDVMDMVAGHVDEALILDSIINAKDVSFDMTPKGLIALGKANVNSRIQIVMSQRARGETGPAPRRR